MLGFFILMIVEEIFGEDPWDEDPWDGDPWDGDPCDENPCVGNPCDENLLNDILEEAKKKDLSYSDIKDIISRVK
jgi:hypothetical protein